MVSETFGVDGDRNTTAASPSSSMSLKVLSLPDVEVDDMQSFAKSHRKSLSLDDKQDLMIGCA